MAVGSARTTPMEPRVGSARTIDGDRSLILAPLAEFYAAAGRGLPAAERVGADDVPPDLRALLAAPEPLTPRLEDRHGESLSLRVLERRHRGDRYARCVVLVRGDGVPLVLGAIAMDLARLAPVARAAVLAESVPFGHILGSALADPDALLRVRCDTMIADALALTRAGGWLYGRRRTVSDASGATVATIVEILAPQPGPRVRVRGTGS